MYSTQHTFLKAKLFYLVPCNNHVYCLVEKLFRSINKIKDKL